MKRSLELLIRIAALVIILYVRSEEFTKFLNVEVVPTLGTALIIGVMFWIKFRSEEKLREVYSNIKYAMPIGNLYLMGLLVWDAYNVNYLNTKLGIVILGLVLTAILLVIDQVFLKNVKKRLGL